MNGTRIGFLAVTMVTGLTVGPDTLSGQDPGKRSGGPLLQRSGQHITLTTDALNENQADALIASFDAAVPQWAEFWKLPPGALDNWRVQACVIRNKELFYRARLIPRRVPDFPFGYALSDRIWVMAQESDYYTRHLLLHEGVHSLSFTQFGGAGPSWFMEGIAELLAVHTGSGAQTKVNQLPRDRESVPFWGRFKLMSARRDKNEIPSLHTVMNYPRDMQSNAESYGWSWAAMMLLSEHDEYRDAYFAEARNGGDSDAVFNARVEQNLKANWPIVVARWRLMCQDLDYGFNWSHEKVALSMTDQVWDGTPRTVDVAADRGWQSIGVRLSPGMKLAITPSGQCTLADQPKPWISEPSGVTIRYYRGRPLGQLLGCIVPNSPDNSESLKPLKVAAITKPVQIPIKEHCWMLFRVNDALGELGDNTGGYQIKVEAGR